MGVARALGADPNILLMDEPFGAIDPIARVRLQNELIRLQKVVAKTIVFVTHNVREAVCLADRVILFSRNPGRIREQFDIPLPRPRDINSVELAEHAGEITRALKGHSAGEVSD